MRKCVDSKTIKETCGCGDIYVTIATNEAGVKNVLAYGGKDGTCLSLIMDVVSKLITENLAHGGDIKSLTKILDNEHCHRQTKTDGKHTYSCLDAISKSIRMSNGG
jgi:ribonucleoside-diphosphate reductase alpha chain